MVESSAKDNGLGKFLWVGKEDRPNAGQIATFVDPLPWNQGQSPPSPHVI